MKDEKFRVLVVEDNHLIAKSLARDLTLLGCEVIGPFGCAEDALPELEDVTAAVLDVRLGASGTSDPLADCLLNREVPFLFYSAYDPDVVPRRFRDVPYCPKPTPTSMLVNRLLRYRARLQRTCVIDAVDALPVLRARARAYYSDPDVADRAVEAVLLRAVQAPFHVRSQAELEDRLLWLLADYHSKGGGTRLH